MRIATWNINGVNSRLEHILRWEKSAQVDVLCLQETKAIDAKFPIAKLKKAGFPYVEMYGEKAYNGVAILSKSPLTDVHKGLRSGEAESARLISVAVNGISIVNAYFPHGTLIGTEKFYSKLAWVKELRRYFDKHFDRDERVLLCGDTNITPHEMDLWNVRYWATRLHFSKEEREVLMHLKKWGFVDVFRQMNDRPGEYTWWDTFRSSSFSENRGLRLDHIWATEPLAELCTDCWVDREPRGWEHPSDHAPVVAEFRV